MTQPAADALADVESLRCELARLRAQRDRALAILPELRAKMRERVNPGGGFSAYSWMETAGGILNRLADTLESAT